MERLIEEVSEWEGIDVTPYRFGGVDIRWYKVEIGHQHTQGMVDIPFTRTTRQVWDQHGLAQKQHLLEDSGWITTNLRDKLGLLCVRDLSRLSLLQKRVRRLPRNEEQKELVAFLEALGIKPVEV